MSAAVTTAATPSPNMPSDELQNRYSSPTWEWNTSMQKWRPFVWHHVTTQHPTFSVVPKGLHVQCSEQVNRMHPIEIPPSITRASRSKNPDDPDPNCHTSWDAPNRFWKLKCSSTMLDQTIGDFLSTQSVLLIVKHNLQSRYWPVHKVLSSVPMFKWA